MNLNLLNNLESSQLFDMCEDFYGNSDNIRDTEMWHEDKNDLGHSDLLGLVIKYCKKYKITLESLIKDYGLGIVKLFNLHNMTNKSVVVTLTKIQQKKYDSNEHYNAHSENILLLAEISNNEDLIEASKYCLKELEKNQGLTEEIKEIQNLILSKIKVVKSIIESQILSFKDFVNERKFTPNPNIDASKKPYYFSQEDDIWENDNDWKFEDRKSTGTKFCTVVKDRNHSSFSLYLDDKNKVGLEYYSGENYTVGSYARSHSRRFDVKDIPKAYQNQFKEMVKAFEYHFKIDLSKYDSNIDKYYDEIKESLNPNLKNSLN